jgi:hypothetical protein
MIEFEDEEIFKATHSSYVLVGAELGRYGMFFYLAVLYASLRILMTSRCHRQEDETSRWAMFVLLLGYLASNWLIDRSYHLEYFFLAGAVSAFHRRLGVEAGLLDQEWKNEEDEPEDHESDEPPPLPEADAQDYDPETEYNGPVLAYQTKQAGLLDEAISRPGDVDMAQASEALREEELTKLLYWRRPSIIDLLLVALFTKIVFDLWDHLLKIYFM